MNINVALSNECGKIIQAIYLPGFKTINNNGSLSHMDTDLEAKSDDSYYEFDVTTIDYKTLVESNNIQNIDFFVLDVEGHELPVIEGMKGCDVLPYLFVIEYPHITLEKLEETLELYLPNKYKLDHIQDNNVFFIRLD